MGVVGGIFAILVALFEVGLAIIGESWFRAFGVSNGTDFSQLYVLAGLCMIAGVLGIAGGAIGKKLGGGFMIVGGVLALIGASLFGVLPFVLMLAGGILALRDKTQPTMRPKEDLREDIVVRLDKLKNLLDTNVITKEEYEQRRKEILSQI